MYIKQKNYLFLIHLEKGFGYLLIQNTIKHCLPLLVS